jgi:heterodisulfide reductase subunit A-like polyferredoxin
MKKLLKKDSRQVRMPSKDYSQKIDHDLGIPLKDDYFYDDPEQIVQTNLIEAAESKVSLPAKPKRKKEKRIINGDVLIIGAGISGMQSALDIADKGFKVVIIDKTSTIGGSMVKLDKTFPTNDCSICTAAPKMVELARHPNIELITYAELNSLKGKIGDFKANVWKKSKYVDPDKCKSLLVVLSLPQVLKYLNQLNYEKNMAMVNTIMFSQRCNSKDFCHRLVQLLEK